MCHELSASSSSVSVKKNRTALSFVCQIAVATPTGRYDVRSPKEKPRARARFCRSRTWPMAPRSTSASSSARGSWPPQRLGTPVGADRPGRAKKRLPLRRLRLRSVCNGMEARVRPGVVWMHAEVSRGIASEGRLSSLTVQAAYSASSQKSSDKFATSPHFDGPSISPHVSREHAASMVANAMIQ